MRWPGQAKAKVLLASRGVMGAHVSTIQESRTNGAAQRMWHTGLDNLVYGSSQMRCKVIVLFLTKINKLVCPHDW